MLDTQHRRVPSHHFGGGPRGVFVFLLACAGAIAFGALVWWRQLPAVGEQMTGRGTAFLAGGAAVLVLASAALALLVRPRGVLASVCVGALLPALLLATDPGRGLRGGDGTAPTPARVLLAPVTTVADTAAAPLKQSVAMAAGELKSLRAALEEQRESSAGAAEELARLRSDAEKDVKAFETLQARMRGLEAARAELETDANRLREEAGKLHAELARRAERTAGLEQTLAASRAETEELRAALQRVRAEAARLHVQVADLAAKVAEQRQGAQPR